MYLTKWHCIIPGIAIRYSSIEVQNDVRDFTRAYIECLDRKKVEWISQLLSTALFRKRPNEKVNADALHAEPAEEGRLEQTLVVKNDKKSFTRQRALY